MLSKGYKYNEINGEQKIIEIEYNDSRFEFSYNSDGDPLLIKFFYMDDLNPIGKIEYKYDPKCNCQIITKNLPDLNLIYGKPPYISEMYEIISHYLKDSTSRTHSMKIVQYNHDKKLDSKESIDLFIHLIKTNCSDFAEYILNYITSDNVFRSIEFKYNSQQELIPVRVKITSKFDENNIYSFETYSTFEKSMRARKKNIKFEYNALKIEFYIEDNELKSPVYEFINFNENKSETTIYQSSCIGPIKKYSKKPKTINGKRIFIYDDYDGICRSQYKTTYYSYKTLSKFFYNINYNNLKEVINCIKNLFKSNSIDSDLRSIDISELEKRKDIYDVVLKSSITSNSNFKRMVIESYNNPTIEIYSTLTSNKDFIRINIQTNNDKELSYNIIIDREGKVRYVTESYYVEGMPPQEKNKSRLKFKRRSSMFIEYNDNIKQKISYKIDGKYNGQVPSKRQCMVTNELKDDYGHVLLFNQYITLRSLFDIKVQEFENELGEALF